MAIELEDVHMNIEARIDSKNWYFWLRNFIPAVLVNDSSSNGHFAFTCATRCDFLLEEVTRLYKQGILSWLKRKPIPLCQALRICNGSTSDHLGIILMHGTK